MSEVKKVVIIGGNALGLACAARLRRVNEKIKIIVFEKTATPSLASCALPYYIGGEMTNRPKLQAAPMGLLKGGFLFDLRLETEVVKIDTKTKTVTGKNLATGESYEETYDKLLCSMGSHPFFPPVPGIRETKNIFSLRNIPDMEAIMGRMKDAKEVLVLGGGFIGIELVEQFKKRGLGVTVAELLPSVVPPLDPELSRYLEKEMRLNGVVVKTSTVVEKFEYDDEKDQVLATLKSFPNGPVDESPSRFDFVCICTGVRPSSSLLKDAGIKLNEKGSCVVNESMQTSDPDVYSGGDLCVIPSKIHGKDVYSPLANSANIQGRIISNNMLNAPGPKKFRGTIQTGIFRCFGLTVSVIGDSEGSLQRFHKMEHKKDYLKLISCDHHRPMYMYQKENCGRWNICMKLMFTPDEGKILGFAAVGEKGVGALANTMSTAIWSGLTIYDLEVLEQPYCPMHGQARSSVNQLGMAAAGIIRGSHKIVFMEEVLGKKDSVFLVDIRPPTMRNGFGFIPDTANIPIPMLRKKLDVLKEQQEKGKMIVTTCNVGRKAYTSSRFLQNNGIDCSFLSGSYFLFERCYKKE